MPLISLFHAVWSKKKSLKMNNKKTTAFFLFRLLFAFFVEKGDAGDTQTNWFFFVFVFCLHSNKMDEYRIRNRIQWPSYVVYQQCFFFLTISLDGNVDRLDKYIHMHKNGRQIQTDETMVKKPISSWLNLTESNSYSGSSSQKAPKKRARKLEEDEEKVENHP